jgi:hypothetical protein
MSKEDIWVSRTRVPISGKVSKHVQQDFQRIESVSDLEYWNLHVPLWAPISTIDIPDSDNRVLQLIDEEPYDYASAERHFPQSEKASVQFSIYVKEIGKDILEFELHNQKDERVLRLRFDPHLEGLNFDLGSVEPRPVDFMMNRWYRVKIVFDCKSDHYNFWLDDKKVRENIEFDIKTDTLERMVFRTGSWRSDVRQFILKGQPHGPGMDTENLPFAGSKVARSIFWIDNVQTNTH